MIKQLYQTLSKGLINSYAQLFFADSKIFAWLLLLSTFVNPLTGLSGLSAAIVALIFSYWIGLNRYYISYGTYSYNALMVGLVLGSQYNFTFSYLIVLLFGSVLSVLFVVWLNAVFAKYKLPSLSLSFLFSFWLVTICARSLSGIELSDNGIFRMNEWYRIGGENLVSIMSSIEELPLPSVFVIYLKSLSAVFFQYNIIAGLIILTGLIIWSRIGFILSVLGFAIGYIFYYSLSGEFSEISYSYIGFNFILTAVALGGFYIIPSRASFVLVLITMPVIGILISGFSGILGPYQLQLYSLPFSIAVILIVMLLNQRDYQNRLALVTHQYYSPEKNLYHYANNKLRFKNSTLVSLRLPFYGEWHVSQGYEGNITHKEDWSKALDFVVVDEASHTFKLPGESLSDFFAYNLPVLAPADGYITEVADGIDDNEIGEVNLKNNWGNTVVIKHTEGLYTKLSHLKKDSIPVKINDYVKAGQIIGYCGNSGRSPEPHLHFQAQSTPFIGSRTLSYPLGYFMSRVNDTYRFHSFEIPEEGAHIHNPVKTPLLQSAFHFTPGKKITWHVEDAKGMTYEAGWECMVNAWNQTYLYCTETQSTAYYVNNGTLFYFTDFNGDKNSLLFEFYLAAQKVLLGYYHQTPVEDTIAPDKFHNRLLLNIQDLVSPFYRFMHVNYRAEYVSLDDMNNPALIVMESEVKATIRKKISREKQFKLTFSNGMLQSWSVIQNQQTLLTATCTVTY